MQIVILGAGVIGRAVGSALTERGYDVEMVGRNSGRLRADITDKASLEQLFATMGPVNAVVSAAGESASGSLADLSDNGWAASLATKLMGQINVVRTALPYVTDGGSFTLTTGIVSDEPIRNAIAGVTVNRGLEGFVEAAALELPRGIRINCISPTVLAGSLGDYAERMPGFVPVEDWKVGQAYLRSILGIITGRVLRV